MEIGILYLGFKRNTKKHLIFNRTESKLGYAKIKCNECLGTEVYILPDEDAEYPCVVCKGTGKIYVNC